MGRKRLAVIIALVTVLGGIPAVSAEHLSVGYEDAIGVSPEENPNAKSVDDEERARGLATDCFDPDGSSTDPGQLQEAAETDPFCGHLVYHENNLGMRQEGPPDQDLRSTPEVDVGLFDVRTTRSYMVAHEARLIHNDVGACQPFCEDNPAGQLAWDSVHTAGEAAGLTDGPEEADQKERDDRLQIYGADVHTLTARYLLQEADAHEMNGWYTPGVTRSFVAFLEDGSGTPIGEDRLETIVGNLKQSGDLPQKATPSVCGWTPDADFVGTGGSFTCEVPFEYEGQYEGDLDFTEGYDDKCKSPTYICSAQAGSAWYANFDCLCGTFAGSDYVRWHWVVAPTLTECGPREPGFLTDSTETGTTFPYLAHDVDVFTNQYALQATDAARGMPAVEATAGAIANEQSQTILSQLPGIDGDNIQPPSSVSKDDRVEPNAQPVGELADTSQSLPSEHPNGGDLLRDLGDPCSQLTASEDEDTVDPWVDLVDGKVTTLADGETHDVDLDDLNATAEGFNVQARPGVYGNDDTGQDDDNHPGPDLYVTDGNVGLFTDKDDDGMYETVAGDTVGFSDMKTNPDSIEATGAYPMLWDVRVQEDQGTYTLDEDAGCQVSGTGLTAGAADAGFGADTALFQAVYLSEPTVFVNPESGEIVPYPAGDNIYLFLSQSAREHYDADESGANPVDEAIDEAVDELQAFTDGETNVEQPGQELGFVSDFKDQCPEDTGGFTLDMGFTHSCQLGCEGDTIVTGYTFELTKDTLGGGASTFLPVFSVNSEAFDFGAGQYTWFDVDPFDNDPTRQDGNDDSPPTGGD